MDITHWEHYEHGADIGVHGVGATKAEAFVQAAIAMTAVITDPRLVRPDTRVDITCEAPDDELLFVDWLNALIYEMASRNMLFSRFELTLDNTRLHGSAWGEQINQARHEPTVEIKDATYTTLRVFEDEQQRWHAQTVVDV